MSALADRFVDLACLTYRADEARARRDEAVAMLQASPALVTESVHAAAAAGDVDALRAHLERDPAAVDRAGSPRAWSPLLALCYSRVPQGDARACLELLLERGADPRGHVMLDGCRFTALTGVMGEGEAGPLEQPPHPDARALAERLLDAGADPDESQGLYNTHFLESDAWLELLLARGLRSRDDLELVLGRAVVQGFAARVRLLLAHGVSPHGRNRYDGRTHVLNAVLGGHDEIARALLTAGATAPQLDERGRFRVAVLAGDRAEAERILAGTPAVASGDALIAAAHRGRVAAVVLALALGAPIDARDHAGLTALHHAAGEGHLDVVRLLVERGASTVVRDPRFGGTPLGHARHMTSRWPRPDGAAIIALLEQHAG